MAVTGDTKTILAHLRAQGYHGTDAALLALANVSISGSLVSHTPLTNTQSASDNYGK